VSAGLCAGTKMSFLLVCVCLCIYIVAWWRFTSSTTCSSPSWCIHLVCVCSCIYIIAWWRCTSSKTCSSSSWCVHLVYVCVFMHPIYCLVEVHFIDILFLIMVHSSCSWCASARLCVGEKCAFVVCVYVCACVRLLCSYD